MYPGTHGELPVVHEAQHTPGVEGYVFDGADGSQMAFWTVEHDAETAEHVHEFDEWFIVVEGSYTLMLDGVEKRIDAGEEGRNADAPRVLLRGAEAYSCPP